MHLENTGLAGQTSSNDGRCLLPANFCLSAPDPNGEDSMLSRTGAVHGRGNNPHQPRLHPEQPPLPAVEEATARLLREEEQRHLPLPHPVIVDSNHEQDAETSDQRDAEGLIAAGLESVELESLANPTHPNGQVTVLTPEELKALEIMIPEEDGSQKSRLGLPESESLIPLDAAPVRLNANNSAAVSTAATACLHSHDVNEVALTDHTSLDRFTSVGPRLLDNSHEGVGGREKGPPVSEAAAQKALVDSLHASTPPKSDETDDTGFPLEETISLQDSHNGKADPDGLESTQRVEQIDRLDLSQTNVIPNEKQDSSEALSTSSPVPEENPLQTFVDDHHIGAGIEQVDVLDSETQQESSDQGSNGILADGNILPNQIGENSDNSSRQELVLQTLDDNHAEAGIQEEILAREIKYLQHVLESIPDAITLIQRIKMSHLCNESSAIPWQRKGDPPAQHISMTPFEASKARAAENPDLNMNSSQQRLTATTPFNSELHREFPFQDVPRQMKDPPCQPWDDSPLNNKVDPPATDCANLDTETNNVWRAKQGDLRSRDSMATREHACQKEDPPCQRWKDKEDPPQQFPGAIASGDGHTHNLAKEDHNDIEPKLQDDFEEERQSTEASRVDVPDDLVPGAVRAHIRHLVDEEDVPVFLPASVRRQARKARAVMTYVPEQQNLEKEVEYGNNSKSANDFEAKGSVHSYALNQPVAGAVHVRGVDEGSHDSNYAVDNLLDSSTTDSFTTHETNNAVVAEVVNTEDLFGELLSFMQRSLPQAEVVRDSSDSQTNKVDSQTDEVSDNERSKKRKPWRWFGGRNRIQQNASMG